jgi:hypothetical protein
MPGHYNCNRRTFSSLRTIGPAGTILALLAGWIKYAPASACHLHRYYRGDACAEEVSGLDQQQLPTPTQQQPASLRR